MKEEAVLCEAEHHSLIVTRWSKSETFEVAEMFICQHCMRLFEWQKLVDRDCHLKGVEKKIRDDMNKGD